MITLKLVDSVQKIEKDMFKAIAEELNSRLFKNRTTVQNKIKEFIADQINNSPEMIELRGGYLQGALGVLNPQAAVNAIKDAVASSVQVVLKKYSNNLKNGGLEIRVQPSNFSTLLSLPEGHTVYAGGDLHWLRWLLEFGDKIIVAGYSYDPEAGLGRTGLGTMDEGGTFRVPPEFSGTFSNNFVTRAIINDATENFMSRTLERTLT